MIVFVDTSALEDDVTVEDVEVTVERSRLEQNEYSASSVIIS